MRSLTSLALAFSSIISGVSSAPHPSAPHYSALVKRCTNSAADRSCWSDNFDLSTNYYDEVPETGETVEVWLALVNTTASLDGVSRNVLTVNGTFPGPTIIANWGDTVIVHLTNGLENNGTSLHFHGIRQKDTVHQDGVVGITQCPTAPGDSITYKWRATQYGSSWYHSHFALQAWEGVLGGIIINGPASANYDVDMGMMFLNDWSHQTADALYASAETQGPPTLDNGLINGTNTYGDVGTRFSMEVTAGNTHRIRLVNGAIDTHFKFMIDNHNLTVMAIDFVPIVPYSTQVLSIGMGQRYDVVVDATESSGNYWIRAIPQTSCSDNANANDIKGLFMYDSNNTTEPTTSAYTFTDDCLDEDLSTLVPYVKLDASSGSQTDDFAVTVGRSSNVFKWYMAGTTFVTPWAEPTLLQIHDNTSSFTTSQHVIELPDANEWVYFIIETTNTVPHPIHLHGHDFFILAQGTGVYSTSTTLNLSNPARRDVAMLPGAGYLVIAFQTDNPGAWLMHCHIGWHTSEGFALQLVERQDEISALIDSDTMKSACVNWEAYAESSGVEQEDSGV